MSDQQDHDHPAATCALCAVLALHEVSSNRLGLFDDPNLYEASRRVIGAWNAAAAQRRRLAERYAQQANLLTVGCPYCEARAGQWCRTRTRGTPYDDTYGPATFHADRKHALADLDTAAPSGRPRLRIVTEQASSE